MYVALFRVILFHPRTNHVSKLKGNVSSQNIAGGRAYSIQDELEEYREKAIAFYSDLMISLIFQIYFVSVRKLYTV